MTATSMFFDPESTTYQMKKEMNKTGEKQMPEADFCE